MNVCQLHWHHLWLTAKAECHDDEGNQRREEHLGEDENIRFGVYAPCAFTMRWELGIKQ